MICTCGERHVNKEEASSSQEDTSFPDQLEGSGDPCKRLVVPLELQCIMQIAHLTISCLLRLKLYRRASRQHIWEIFPAYALQNVKQYVISLCGFS